MQTAVGAYPAGTSLALPKHPTVKGGLKLSGAAVKRKVSLYIVPGRLAKKMAGWGQTRCIFGSEWWKDFGHTPQGNENDSSVSTEGMPLVECTMENKTV